MVAGSRSAACAGAPAPAADSSTLARVDYADAFVVDVGSAARRRRRDTGCARSWKAHRLRVRAQLLSGWSAIGLKVRSGVGTIGARLGGPAKRPDHVLLGADSRIGMPGELLLQKGAATRLLFATFVQHEQSARARGVGRRPSPRTCDIGASTSSSWPADG